jgi:hypothetical protein
MIDRPLELAISLWGDRHFPASVARDVAIQIEASGAADGLLICDMLPHFLPTQLWTTEHTPLASVLKDPDSNSDAFALAAYVMGAVPSLKLSVSTDSVRRPPAELVQTMLTLANITEGKVSFHVGGGEVKQCKAYGHKRSQGMTRMEDLLRIFQLLTDSDGPIDFQGRHWTFERASIGSAIPDQRDRRGCCRTARTMGPGRLRLGVPDGLRDDARAGNRGSRSIDAPNHRGMPVTAFPTRTRSPVRIDTVAVFVPTTHGMPSSRATTAAWLIGPPISVTSAAVTNMIDDQLGSVVWAIRTWSGSTSANDGSVTT